VKNELVSDVIDFTTAGAFTHVSTFKATQNGQERTGKETVSGTYSVNGTVVTLNIASDSSTTIGSWTGNTLTVQDQGFVAVYKR
jgi:hypothetical protein